MRYQWRQLAMYKIIALNFVSFEYSYLTLFQRKEVQTSEPRVTVRYALKGENVSYILFLQMKILLK